MEALPADVATPEGRIVTLTRDDWLHVKLRHPEVGTDPVVLMGVVSWPDEVHQDSRGGYMR